MSLPILESIIDTNAWEVLHTTNSSCSYSGSDSNSVSTTTTTTTAAAEGVTSPQTTSNATKVRLVVRRVLTTIQVPREHYQCCYARLQLATRLADVNQAHERGDRGKKGKVAQDSFNATTERYREYSSAIRDVLSSVKRAAAAAPQSSSSAAAPPKRPRSSFSSSSGKPAVSVFPHGKSDPASESAPTTSSGSSKFLSLEYVNRVPAALRGVPGSTATVTFHLSAFTTTAGDDNANEDANRSPPLPPFLGYRNREAVRGKTGSVPAIELLPLIEVHRTRTPDPLSGVSGQREAHQNPCYEWKGVYLPFSVDFPMPTVAKNRSPSMRANAVLSLPSNESTGIQIDVYSLVAASNACEAAYRHFTDELLQQTFAHERYYSNLQRFALNPAMRSREFNWTSSNAATVSTQHRNTFHHTLNRYKNSVIWQHAALLRTRHPIPIEPCVHPTPSLLSSVIPKDVLQMWKQTPRPSSSHDTYHLSGLSTLPDLLNALQRNGNSIKNDGDVSK